VFENTEFNGQDRNSYVGDNKCIQTFGGETWKGDTWNRNKDTIKMDLRDRGCEYR
jgi:hypothetical protein